MKNRVLITCALLLLAPATVTAKETVREEKPICASTDESCLMNLAGKSGVIIRVTEPDGSVTFYAGFKNGAKSTSPNASASTNTAATDVLNRASGLYTGFYVLWSSANEADDLSDEDLKAADAAAEAYFEFIRQHPDAAYEIRFFAARGNRYWGQIQTVWNQLSPETRFETLNEYIDYFEIKSSRIRSEDLPSLNDTYTAILMLKETIPQVSMFNPNSNIYLSTKTAIQKIAPDVYETLFGREEK